MLIKQRISGKFGSLAAELSFEAKRRADIPPSKRSGRGENHCFSCFLRFIVFFKVIEYSGRLKQLLSGKFFAVLTNEVSFILICFHSFS